MRICAIIFCLLLSVGARAQSGNTTHKDTTIYQLLQSIKSQPGTSDPLVILNDSIYKGDIHLVNSKDIESVDVIKGDDAKQIYGSKAKNGAFLMKTKSYLETGAGYSSDIIDLPRKRGEMTQKDTSRELIIHDAATNINSKPFIILDDSVYKGSLESINPKSINSVDVLKGYKATTLYGAKAANGVIIIKTKKYNYGRQPDFSSVTEKDTSYVIDGQLSANKYHAINPNDIVSITILKNSDVGDKHISDSNKVTVIIITKSFAIGQYQQKFSNYSNDYKIYFSDPKNNDKEFLYVLNGVPVDQTKNDEIKKLYDISPKKIKVVLFKGKGSELGNIKPLVIITTKK